MKPIRLNSNWRVNLITTPPQYVLQQRSISKKTGEENWEGKSYCQTQRALLTMIDEKVVRAAHFYQGAESMAVDMDAYDEILALPERATNESR